MSYHSLKSDVRPEKILRVTAVTILMEKTLLVLLGKGELGGNPIIVAQVCYSRRLYGVLGRSQN